jgi:hypothetical protein
MLEVAGEMVALLGLAALAIVLPIVLPIVVTCGR